MGIYSTLRNFKADILEELEGEQIECVVFLQTLANIRRDKSEKRDNADLIRTLRQPIPWEVAQSWLDYSYDPGFGCMDCHDIVIYTPTRIFCIHEYDGSTSLQYVMRNPTGYILDSTLLTNKEGN